MHKLRNKQMNRMDAQCKTNHSVNTPKYEQNADTNHPDTTNRDKATKKTTAMEQNPLNILIHKMGHTEKHNRANIFTNKICSIVSQNMNKRTNYSPQRTSLQRTARPRSRCFFSFCNFCCCCCCCC